MSPDASACVGRLPSGVQIGWWRLFPPNVIRERDERLAVVDL
jgi:hypothetical protein